MSLLPRVWRMPHPYHPPSVQYPNNIWWGVQTMMALLRHFLQPPITAGFTEMFSVATQSWTPSAFFLNLCKPKFNS
jgi:hypothetical protein